MDSEQVLARFEAERQALALMDHPNIAKVLDAGVTPDGRPFFVMELVKGVPITKYCDEHHLTPRQRLELFVPVCQAIQHAHQKGIIHRDIKPSQRPGRPVRRPPGAQGDRLRRRQGDRPAADRADAAHRVRGGGRHGRVHEPGAGQRSTSSTWTPAATSTRSACSCTSCWPAARRSPKKELEKAGMLEMLRVIREQEPSKPSTKLSTADGLPTLAANRGTEPAKLTRLVRGELDWIVMKALEKDRNRRYETANGFAMDVQRVPGGRAGAGVPAVARVPLPEVRAAEQASGLGCRDRAAHTNRRDHWYNLRARARRAGAARRDGTAPKARPVRNKKPRCARRKPKLCSIFSTRKFSPRRARWEMDSASGTT